MAYEPRMIIETDGLTKTFGEVQAVRDLSMCVPEHSIVGFLGPNGSGKSTTIKLLLGLLRPTCGAARMFGLDLVQQGHEIRRRVGYLPQAPRFPETMTARRVLEFTGRFYLGAMHDEIGRLADEMLELVGLEQKAETLVKGFSGGERQRLGIAQAQIGSPELLILDEPAAALDPMGRHAVLEIMTRLRETCTIFYSTHILDDVERVSDHVIIIKSGELVTEGPIGDIVHRDAGTRYRIDLSGDLEPARTAVELLPWVGGVDVIRSNGHDTWSVRVSDESAAQEGLLRTILAHPQVDVLAYRRQEQELEDAFIALVQEEA